MTTMNNIWADSECVVEEEYNTPPAIKKPHLTNEFKNVLIENKGDISTARKFTSNNVMKKESNISLSSVSEYESYESSNSSISSFESCDIEIIRNKLLGVDTPCNARQVSCKEPRRWSELCKERRGEPSTKLLQKMIK